MKNNILRIRPQKDVLAQSFNILMMDEHDMMQAGVQTRVVI